MMVFYPVPRWHHYQKTEVGGSSADAAARPSGRRADPRPIRLTSRHDDHNEHQLSRRRDKHDHPIAAPLPAGGLEGRGTTRAASLPASPPPGR